MLAPSTLGPQGRHCRQDGSIQNFGDDFVSTGDGEQMSHIGAQIQELVVKDNDS